MSVWYKADSGPLTPIEGTPVLLWNDMSSNTNNQSQSTSSKQPIFRNNLSDNINFNPVVDFDGIDDELNYAPGILGAAIHTNSALFAVTRTDEIKDHTLIDEFTLASGHFLFHNPWVDGNIHWDGANNNRLSNAWNHTLGAPYLWTGHNNNTLATRRKLRVNGLTINSSTAVLNSFQGNSNPLNLGSEGGLKYFNGKIGEVMIYLTALTDLQRLQIESYLAIKYGFTLDQTTAQNYIASDGSTIYWDATTNAIYSNNIAGIARDDGSALTQKQSRSVNTGLQIVIGNGNTIAASNPDNATTFSANNSALLWGDDNGPYQGWTSTGAPTAREIIARTWKTQEIGSVGSVKIQIADNSGTDGLPVEHTNVYLLVDSDGDFTSGAVEHSMTLNGTNWEVDIDLTTGQFLTFATLAAPPENCGNVLDDDFDGFVDGADPDCQDQDSDGIANYLDIDQDNDGIPDADEGCGVTSDISSTIGYGNNLTNGSHGLTGTTITYARSGASEATITGYDAGAQGPSLRIQSSTTASGTIVTTFSNPISSVYFKLTDFDNLEDHTVNVYDENAVLYDLTTEGVFSVGALINQTGNQFVGTTSTYAGGSDTDGNDPVDDYLASVLFSFPGQVSRIDIIYSHSENSSIRFTELSFCSRDTDGDDVFDHLDLDSDNDGIFDLDEAGHSAVDANEDGIIDGVSSAFGTNGLFDAIETVADNGILNYSISDSEVTPDGIYDAYELDSDADGCNDTDEELISDSDSDGIAGTGIPTVLSNGLVVGILYTSPTLTYWQDLTITGCVEVCTDGVDNDGDGDIDCEDSDCTGVNNDDDGDGICNLYDLDDDNDGILDDIESLELDTYSAGCSFPAYDFSNPTLESGVDETVGAIYRYTNVTPGTDALVEIISMTNATIDTLDDEYSGQGFLDAFQPIINVTATGTVGVEMNFKFVDSGTSTLSTTINRIGGTAFDVDGSLGARRESYLFQNPAVTGLDNPSFIDYKQTASGVEFSSLGRYEGLNIDTDSRLRIYFLYRDTSEFTIQFQIHNAIATSTGPRRYALRFDECEVLDFASINLIIENGEDHDNDGVDNHLDLDSDNDGIFDVDEAGHTSVDADDNGVIDGAPILFGSNGLFDALETNADSDTINYIVGDSEATPDGIYDAYELDADGDTCFDALEENVNDPDTDGIAGTTPVTVDLNGLVNTITYTSPPNGTWQNPINGPCLSEICNDGFDNDADGDVDNLDSDCCGAQAPVLSKN